MTILLLILFSEMVSAVIGSIMLIQQGGWFPILIAILLILGALINTSVALASGFADVVNHSKNTRPDNQGRSKL